MLAMDVNDDAGSLIAHVVLVFIASMPQAGARPYRGSASQTPNCAR